jgi:hypothetical protein
VRDRVVKHIDREVGGGGKGDVRKATGYLAIALITCIAAYYYCITTFEIP